MKQFFLSFNSYLGQNQDVRTLIRGAGGSAVAKATALGIAFVAQIVLARLLGAGSYGNYIYALTWMQVLLLIGKMGFDTASIRFVAEYCGQQQWGLLQSFLRHSIRIVLAFSLGASALLALGAWLLREHITRELLHTLWVAAVVLPVLAALQVHCASLRGLKKVVRADLAELTIRPLLLMAGLLLVVLWPREDIAAPTAMAIDLSATLVSMATATWLLHKALPVETWSVQPSPYIKQWFRTAWSLVLVAGLALLLFRTDVIMVGALLGPREAGIYAVGSRIAALLALVLVGVNTIFSPMAADLYARNELRRLHHLFRISTGIAFAGSLLMGVGVVVFGRPVIGLFGPSFGSAYLIAMILLSGQLVGVLVGPTGVMMNMTGHESSAARVLAFSTGLNIVLNALLIPAYGPRGAAIATAGTMVLANVIFAYLVWQHIGISVLPFAPAAKTQP